MPDDPRATEYAYVSPIAATSRLAATAADSLALMYGARLIAEDDVNIVAVITISKAWLAGHMAFLAALADAGCGARQLS